MILLAEALREMGVVDSHIFDLEKEVKDLAAKQKRIETFTEEIIRTTEGEKISVTTSTITEYNIL